MLKCFRTTIYSALGILALIMLSPVNAAPIFSDGFESGDLSAWSGSSAPDAGDTIGVSSTQTSDGSYSLRAEIDSDPTNPQAMVWKNFTGQTTLYAKIRIFLPLDFTLQTGGHVTVMQFLSGWSNILGLSIKDDMSLYLWNAVAGEAYGWGATSPISTDVWHTLALMATISPTQGEARLWLDGNLEIDTNGKNLGSNPINKFATGIYWANDRDQANTVHVDSAYLTTAVPEPGSLILLGIGLIGLAFSRRFARA